MKVYEQLNLSLRRMEEEGTALSDILASERHQPYGPLFEQILKGIMENRDLLDALLCVLSKLPLKRYRRIEYYYLLIGAYGIVFLDKPDYAVIDSIVNLMKRTSPHRAGATNAILRRLAREQKELISTVLKEKPVAQRLSIQYSVHPELVEMLLEQFHVEEVESYFVYAQKSPPLDICVINEDREKYFQRLLEQGISSKELEGTFAGLRLEGKDRAITSLPGFSEGQVYVMGYAAQLLSELVPVEGKLLDLCAAPGGKSICIKNRLPGTSLTSCDISATRVQTMKENFDRVHVEAVICQQDALKDRPDFHETFDVVLLDAPCTSSGLLHRHPDLRQAITRERVESSAQLQKQLLTQAAKYVKKQGFLIYCTCSILNQEGSVQIESFLRANKDFALTQPIRNTKIDSKGFFRTQPWEDDCDGFFGAVLQKERA